MIKILFSIVVVIISSLPARAERPLNELPMYGGQNTPTVERNREFSNDAVQRGWKAYYRGDFATAIKRFNQGWMFDRENPEVFWGFGLIIGQRAYQETPEKHLEESIKYLHMAREKAPNNGKIIGDLAYSHTLLGQYLKTEKGITKEAHDHFRVAGSLFIEANKKEPDYPPNIANWSIFYFYTEAYTEAKSKADKAIRLGYQFDQNYLKELENSLQ